MSGLSLEAFKRRNRGKGYAELLRLLKSKNDELLRLGGTSKKM